jgi:hypothetical protein
MRWKESISWLEEVEKKMKYETWQLASPSERFILAHVSYWVECTVWSLSALQADVSMKAWVLKYQIAECYAEEFTVESSPTHENYRYCSYCLAWEYKPVSPEYVLDALYCSVQLGIFQVQNSVNCRTLLLRHSFSKKVTLPVVNTVFSFLLISLRGRDVS